MTEERSYRNNEINEVKIEKIHIEDDNLKDSEMNKSEDEDDHSLEDSEIDESEDEDLNRENGKNVSNYHELNTISSLTNNDTEESSDNESEDSEKENVELKKETWAINKETTRGKLLAKGEWCKERKTYSNNVFLIEYKDLYPETEKVQHNHLICRKISPEY